MANLPKAKGALDPLLSPADKKAERINTASAQILTAAVSSIAAPPGPLAAEGRANAQNGGEADLRSRVPAPGNIHQSDREPTTRRDSLTKDLTQKAEEYSTEQERLARNKMATRKVEEERDTKNRDTTKSTSVWLPAASKKELMNLQLRMFDYEVPVTLKTLVLYSLDKLRLLPDEDIARELLAAHRDKRRKEFRDAPDSE